MVPDLFRRCVPLVLRVLQTPVIAKKKIISIPVDFGRDPRLCWPEKQAKTCMTCGTCRSNLILHPGWFPACSEGFPGVFRGCCGFYIQTPFGHFKRNHTDPRRLRQRAKTLLARERKEGTGCSSSFLPPNLTLRNTTEEHIKNTTS